MCAEDVIYLSTPQTSITIIVEMNVVVTKWFVSAPPVAPSPWTYFITS